MPFHLGSSLSWRRRRLDVSNSTAQDESDYTISFRPRLLCLRGAFRLSLDAHRGTGRRFRSPPSDLPYCSHCKLWGCLSLESMELQSIVLALALAAAAIQVLKETYSVLTHDGQCKKTGTRIGRSLLSLGSIIAAAGAGAYVLMRPNQWKDIEKLSSTTKLLASILFVSELTVFGFGIIAEMREEYYKRYQEGPVFGWQFEALVSAVFSLDMVVLSVLTVITRWSPKFLFVWDLVVYILLAMTYSAITVALVRKSKAFGRFALLTSLVANGVVLGLAGWAASQGGGFDQAKYARILGISLLASVSEELVMIAKMRRVREYQAAEERLQHIPDAKPLEPVRVLVA